MKVMIQYLLADGSWSDWTPYVVQDGQLLDGVRFARVLKDENPEKPNVAWMIVYEGHLYEVKKNRNQFNKATPVVDKALNSLAIEEVEGDFSLEAFDEMFNSAKDYLAPCLFNREMIEDLLVRPADASQNMNLMAAETVLERSQNWWQDLHEKYFQDVKSQLMDIVAGPMTRQQQIDALKSFLRQHHEWIGGTCLDYVSIPNHPVTLGLIEIAERIAAETKIPAVSVLMPGIATESFKTSFKDLTELSLKEMIENHIALSPQFLLPVWSINEYIESPNETLYSPYCLDSVQFKTASSEDIKALFEHSNSTQDIRTAFQAYQSLLTQDDNLLGQLNLLGKNLKLYDAHGGLGQQASAGSGAYAAIINFMLYYLSLEPCYLSLTQVSHLDYVV